MGGFQDTPHGAWLHGEAVTGGADRRRAGVLALLFGIACYDRHKTELTRRQSSPRTCGESGYRLPPLSPPLLEDGNLYAASSSITRASMPCTTRKSIERSAAFSFLKKPIFSNSFISS